MRRALSHAAIELATARGSMETVPVDDITRAAQVSRRTFFNYFPTKADAIAWPLAVFRRRLLAELTARPADEPIWAALEASATLALTDPATDLTDLHRAGRLIGTTTIRNWEGQIATRTGAADAYPQLVAATAGAGIHIAIAHWARHGGAVGDHLAHNFALIRSGLPDPREAP